MGDMKDKMKDGIDSAAADADRASSGVFAPFPQKSKAEKEPSPQQFGDALPGVLGGSLDRRFR